MGKTTYDRAKYVSENAPPEVIDQLDKEERTIRGTYDELRAKEKAASALPADGSADTEGYPPEETEDSPVSSPQAPEKPPVPKRVSEVSEEEQMKYLSARDKEELRRRKEFSALSPEGKIADLERQLFDMRVRAHAAESDIETLKYEYGIKVDHKDSIIDSLKRQVAELSEALESAEKRIEELEK
jgi:Zn-dependent M32 family carboxypeptidase